MAVVKGRAGLRVKMPTDVDIVRARLWLGVLFVASVLAFVLVAAFIVAGARDGAL